MISVTVAVFGRVTDSVTLTDSAFAISALSGFVVVYASVWWMLGRVCQRPVEEISQ